MVEFDALERELMADPEFVAGHEEVQTQMAQTVSAERMAAAGIFLRLEREEQHLGADYVARRSDLNTGELDLIEKGTFVPSYGHLERIAQALGDRAVQQIKRWNEELPFEVESVRIHTDERSSPTGR